MDTQQTTAWVQSKAGLSRVQSGTLFCSPPFFFVPSFIPWGPCMEVAVSWWKFYYLPSGNCFSAWIVFLFSSCCFQWADSQWFLFQEEIRRAFSPPPTSPPLDRVSVKKWPIHCWMHLVWDLIAWLSSADLSLYLFLISKALEEGVGRRDRWEQLEVKLSRLWTWTTR